MRKESYLKPVIPATPVKIMVLAAKLNQSLQQACDHIVAGLGKHVTDSVFVHYSELHTSDQWLPEDVSAQYQHFICMPDFSLRRKEPEIVTVLKKIQVQNFLFDKGRGSKSEEGEFNSKLCSLLCSGVTGIEKYQKLILVTSPNGARPVAITKTFQSFCEKNHIVFNLTNHIRESDMTPCCIFVILTEDDLADVVRNIRHLPLPAGRQVNLIYFDEPLSNELTEITMFSVKLEKLGDKVADVILQLKS